MGENIFRNSKEQRIEDQQDSDGTQNARPHVTKREGMKEDLVRTMLSDQNLGRDLTARTKLDQRFEKPGLW